LISVQAGPRRQPSVLPPVTPDAFEVATAALLRDAWLTHRRRWSFTQSERQMSSVGYHEPVDQLSEETRDMHRAIVSLMEELEAIDWYNQRADACKDPELKAILAHNRDEEKEHASMVLEWIRRRDPRFSTELKDYLFSDRSIAHD
jgi:hypothetical protein